jgi:heptosyltransferase-2
LVIQPLPGIGDMVWHIPHIKAIAVQSYEGKVSILTKPRSLADQLFANVTEVDEVLWLRRRPGNHDGVFGFFRLIHELRKKRFHTVWLLHDSAYYAWASFLAGIPVRNGFGGKWKRFLLSRCLKNCPPQGYHRVEKSDWLLNGLGITIHRYAPPLHPNQEIVERVLERFQNFNHPWVVLGVGCSETSRQWGTNNFCALIKELSSSFGGTYFLLGGLAEGKMIETILVDLESQSAVPLIQYSIQEIIGLMSLADLFVGNDSGMLNISAATGLTTIGLFGHPISAWVAKSSPYIRPVYPQTGMSESGISQITVSQVTETIRHLQSSASDANVQVQQDL